MTTTNKSSSTFREGSEILDFVCVSCGGQLSLGQKNNRGGISTLHFSLSSAEKTLAQIKPLTLNARIAPTGSPNKFKICFNSRP